MVFSWWLQMAMSSWCTKQVVTMCANCSVVFCRILGDIAPRFDWFFHLLHQFEGDMLY